MAGLEDQESRGVEMSNENPRPDSQGKQPVRGWEYARIGDYHRNLDLNWSYAPTYLSKMRIIRSYLANVSKESRVLDAGCGEGVLVEEFRQAGFQIEGIDLNYESEHVKHGDLRQLPYPDRTFDVVLLLDVFEHIEFSDQTKVLSEIHRVLRSEGTLLATIPNLAHWNSRVMMSLFGRLDRSDLDLNHPGERPYSENREILIRNSLAVRRVKGITLTVPVLIKFIKHFPRQLRWLHDVLDLFAPAPLSMLNFFECVKRD
jgi:SAM-dependent methyltransferase